MAHPPKWSWRDGETLVEEHEHLFGYDVVFSFIDDDGGVHPFTIVQRTTPMPEWMHAIARRVLITRSVENWPGFTRSLVALHEE
jgi:hypothetical protein